MIITKKEYEQIIRTDLELEILFKKLIKPNCLSGKYSEEAYKNGIPVDSCVNVIYGIIEDYLQMKKLEEENNKLIK